MIGNAIPTLKGPPTALLFFMKEALFVWVYKFYPINHCYLIHWIKFMQNKKVITGKGSDSVIYLSAQ